MENVVITEGSGATSWVSLFIAALALGITIYWNKRSERRSYLDAYWFRQVVAPKCIDPVLGFHDSWLRQLERLNDTPVDAAFATDMLSRFQREKSALLDATWVAQIFSLNFYRDACLLLDEAEDAFAANLGEVVLGRRQLSQAQAAMKKALADAAVGVLAEAAHIHDGLKPREGAKRKKG